MCRKCWRTYREQAKDGDQVSEVAEDSLGVIRAVHVGEKAEENTCCKSINWNTSLVSLGKESGRLALDSKAMKSTTAGKRSVDSSLQERR